MDLLKRYIPVLFLLAVVVAIQLVTHFTETPYYLTQLTMSAYYSVVVIGLCVLMGYGGQISLGHAGFFAIGGYLAGALTTHNLMPFQDHGMVLFLDKVGLLMTSQDLYGTDLLTVEPWAAFILAVLAAGLLLGIIEAFSVSVLPLAFQDAIATSILLLILFVRPHGLFGSSEAASLKEF